MKIEQLPLFFSTSGALTKSNSSSQEEVIDRLDLDVFNIDLDYTIVGKTQSNTPLEAPHDFYAYAFVYAADVCHCSNVHSFIINTNVDTISTSNDISNSLVSSDLGMRLSFLQTLLHPLKK